MKSILPSKRARLGRIHPILLMAVCVGGGIAIGAFAVLRVAHQRDGGTPGVAGEESDAQAAALSEPTRALLGRLTAPVEIRYYRILDSATVPDATKAFAARADRLIAEYQQSAPDKIKVTRIDTSSYATAKAASADGIAAFNLDKGDASFLGIAVSRNGNKQTLARLTPDFEKALESDLTRAISSVGSTGEAALPPKPVNQDVARNVKETVPNLESVSLDEGTKLLREAALKEFKAAAEQVQQDIKRAQQALTDAQARQSDAEIQTALKQLQEVQSTQTEKLKDIAARLQEQLDTLHQLKSQPR